MRINKVKLPKQTKESSEAYFTVYRNDDKKIYTESLFYYKLVQELRKQGFDVIRAYCSNECMYGAKYWIRTRLRRKQWPEKSIYIFDPNYAIDFVYTNYNQRGHVDLRICFNADKD